MNEKVNGIKSDDEWERDLNADAVYNPSGTGGGIPPLNLALPRGEEGDLPDEDLRLGTFALQGQCPLLRRTWSLGVQDNTHGSENPWASVLRGQRSGSPDRPPSPVNVTVTHLRANSATVSWDVPEGNIVIGYSISQQRQNGPGQRVIREVNTTTRACALWGLAEDSDYTVQVRSIGLRGESPPGPRVHFQTLKGSDRLPSNSSSPGDITVEGLDGERPLQTGEVVIIVVVLLMWAGE
ncbi:PREDICTED: fibronectin type III domain-containing protein 4 [Colobus angolensis palliatus]|uniref:fibronectin type III domain-containing protein 4 n=1 Tax=Colobus angolensis palliatus TaxID=336983 RepID=UPI0005F55287|nr:PREDICTED: fibronectin type III domain-containing protein 4 [Colobus angolensis palliatus]